MARRRRRSAVVERVSASIRKPEVDNGSAPAEVLHEQPTAIRAAALLDPSGLSTSRRRSRRSSPLGARRTGGARRATASTHTAERATRPASSSPAPAPGPPACAHRCRSCPRLRRRGRWRPPRWSRRRRRLRRHQRRRRQRFRRRRFQRPDRRAARHRSTCSCCPRCCRHNRNLAAPRRRPYPGSAGDTFTDCTAPMESVRRLPVKVAPRRHGGKHVARRHAVGLERAGAGAVRNAHGGRRVERGALAAGHVGGGDGIQAWQTPVEAQPVPTTVPLI